MSYYQPSHELLQAREFHGPYHAGQMACYVRPRQAQAGCVHIIILHPDGRTQLREQDQAEHFRIDVTDYFNAPADFFRTLRDLDWEADVPQQ